MKSSMKIVKIAGAIKDSLRLQLQGGVDVVL